MKDDKKYYVVKSKLSTLFKYPEMTKLVVKRTKITNHIWVETCFLLNLHLLKLLIRKKQITFNYRTIEMCALFVLGLKGSIRNKDDEYKSLLGTYNGLYKIIGTNNVTQYAKFKSIKKPIEYLSRQLMTNVKNHVSLNFLKFQKRYLKAIVFNEFEKLKVEKSIMYSLLGCIQYHINRSVKTITIRSPKLLEHSNIKQFLPIMARIISSERKKVPKCLSTKVSNANLRKNYGEVIRYYYNMSGYLEELERKRFSFMPQLSLGNSYIRFDSRLLSVFYDEWIKTKPNNVPLDYRQVGIKEFEKNYKKYYKSLFNLEKLNVKEIPISFMTNGYSVCIVFPQTNKSSNNDSIQSAENVKLDNFFGNKKFKRGLFDADSCTASDKFLNKFHKIGIDPNNESMLYCQSETGHKLDITKSYFNEISHIKRNNKKMKNRIKESNMEEVYKEFLTTNYRKTIKLGNYIKYIRIYRRYWNIIWNFYNSKKVQKLELDTYIHRKKAIHKVARQIVPKRGGIKFQKLRSDYIDSLDSVKNKPIMVAFGKGNGSTTITNLKNSGPKGPIKAIARELCKLCPVILTDEYNTSQVCSKCNTKSLNNPIETITKVRRTKVNNLRKKITELIQRKCHSLCHCNNEAHMTGLHNVWNRDYNASRNILNVMTKKVLNKDLGIFKRTQNKTKAIRFSLEKRTPE